MRRERKRTAKELEGMVYYPFGGKCYHRRNTAIFSLPYDRFHLGSTTVCGHRIDHTDDNPQRVWRGTPEWAARHEYKPCKICFGRNYVYKPE